jgi:hypothetical protein
MSYVAEKLDEQTKLTARCMRASTMQLHLILRELSGSPRLSSLGAGQIWHVQPGAVSLPPDLVLLEALGIRDDLVFLIEARRCAPPGTNMAVITDIKLKRAQSPRYNRHAKRIFISLSGNIEFFCLFFPQ